MIKSSVPEILVDTLAINEDTHKALKLVINTNETTQNTIKFKQLPLITHTGPTPLQTPSASPHGSPSSKKKLKFMENKPARRSLSLSTVSQFTVSLERLNGDRATTHLKTSNIRHKATIL